MAWYADTRGSGISFGAEMSGGSISARVFGISQVTVPTYGWIGCSENIYPSDMEFVALAFGIGGLLP